MANNEPMHVYPNPDGNNTASTPFPAEYGPSLREIPTAEGVGTDADASTVTAAGSDQTSA
jgi:hypothetical protein